MLRAADIEAALRQALPAEYYSAIPHLAQALAEASTGALSPDEAQARLASSRSLSEALHALNGRRIEAGNSVISFDDTQMGDVTISGDIAGRDVIKIHVNLLPSVQATPEAPKDALLWQDKVVVEIILALWESA